MSPTSYFLCLAALLAGLDSVCNGQLNQKQGQGTQLQQDLIAAASKNGGRRSNSKKNSRSSDDDYHEVYESKPEKYSNSYHHSDSYKEPTRTRTYSNNNGDANGGAGYGRTSYSNSNPNRRQDQRSSNKNNYQQEDYDDYDDNPRQQQPQKKQKQSVPYNDEVDYDTYDTSQGRGYDHNEKYDKSQKDDYHKTGELKEDFDDFGREGQQQYRGGFGRGNRDGGRRNNYSNSNSNAKSNGEIGDSDYVDDDSSRGYSSGSGSRTSGGGGGGSGGRQSRRDDREDDDPTDRYEQRTRQALKEYGTLDGGAFLSANQYKKKK